MLLNKHNFNRYTAYGTCHLVKTSIFYIFLKTMIKFLTLYELFDQRNFVCHGKIRILRHLIRVSEFRQRECQIITVSMIYLQVTSSCSSVYVDGSEIRGSSNATVIVKYETYIGTAHFIVWVPEINEMDLTIADQKLNQVKGWRVPVSLDADDDMDE